jgi:hypothetical protein
LQVRRLEQLVVDFRLPRELAEHLVVVPEAD